MKEKWKKGIVEEAEKTGPLEQVCSALREELDAQNQQRMDALNKKFVPLAITDEPSRKVLLKYVLHRHLNFIFRPTTKSMQ